MTSGGMLDQFLQRFYAFAMSKQAGQLVLIGPAPVAVHDYGHVPNPSLIARFGGRPGLLCRMCLGWLGHESYPPLVAQFYGRLCACAWQITIIYGRIQKSIYTPPPAILGTIAFMLLRPDYLIDGDVTDIDLDLLARDGVRGLIFDLDSTLVAPHAGCLTKGP